MGVFHITFNRWFFHWRLTDSKSSQISRILRRIKADFNTVVVWVDSILPHDLQVLHNPFQALGDRSKDSNYNWYYRHQHLAQLFSSLIKSKYFCILSISFIFTKWFAGTVKSIRRQFFFVLFNFFCLFVCLFVSLINIQLGFLAWVQGSVYITKSQIILCISFYRTDSSLYIYHLVVWQNFNVLHNSQWTTFPTQSCLLLYSFIFFFFLSFDYEKF